jgi:hypothetical protein
LTLQPVVFDRHVLAIDDAVFVEALAKRGDIASRRISTNAADHSNNRYRGLLSARRERPRDRGGRAAEEDDELPPSHCFAPRQSITARKCDQRNGVHDQFAPQQRGAAHV